MTRAAARVAFAAHPKAHGDPKQLPAADTGRALRATIPHGMHQCSWSIISVPTAELPRVRYAG
jgi:hypothetical protein